MAVSYTKTPVLQSLFNSQYCEIFQSTYFEEHLQTAASENVFILIKRINITLKKPRFFQHQYQKQVKVLAFISWLVSCEVFVHSHTIFLWHSEKYTLNTKYPRVNQKKIKSSRNEYVIWTCFKFWPMKNILRKL